MLNRKPIQGFDAQRAELFSSNPDLSKINKNPYNTEFVGIGADQTNLFGYRVPDEIIKAQEERRKNNPINMFNVSLFGTTGELKPQQAIPSTPNTESLPLPGLRQDNFIRDEPLSQISDPAELQKAFRSLGVPTNPTQIGIQDIETSATAPETGLFNRVGQQLMGYDDQFSGINDRLNKIEEGIASLIQNRGETQNMNTGGLGYFFNPFGGFYG